MERDHFDALLALGDVGRDLNWGFVKRERESSERERATLIELHNSQNRERDLISGQLQDDLNFALGHATVRTVLEQIVTAAFPGKSVNDALIKFCNDGDFQAYLETVSVATHFATADLIKSGKNAYSALSETTHHGSTFTDESVSVPQTVLRDKSMLCAISAIFKYGRRKVRFYVGDPRVLFNVPSPPRTPAQVSPAASAARTPPKEAPVANASAAPV